MIGSSEGIGKVYVRELVKWGVNIVFISRGENWLYKIVEDISMLINERSYFYNDNLDVRYWNNIVFWVFLKLS